MTMQAVLDSVKEHFKNGLEQYFLGTYCFYDHDNKKEITSDEFDSLEEFFNVATKTNRSVRNSVYCHVKNFGEVARCQYFEFDEISLEELHDEFSGGLRLMRTRCANPNGWLCNFENFYVLHEGINHAHGDTIQDAMDNFVSLNNKNRYTTFCRSSKFGDGDIFYTTSIRCNKLKFDNCLVERNMK